jgi:hypothetical protein
MAASCTGALIVLGNVDDGKPTGGCPRSQGELGFSEALCSGLIEVYPPRDVQVRLTEAGYVVVWEDSFGANPERNFRDFIVYRRDAPDLDWRPIAMVPIQARGSYLWLDLTSPPAPGYSYAVQTRTVYRRQGNLIEASEASPIE